MEKKLEIAIRNDIGELPDLAAKIEDFISGHALPTKIAFEVNVAVEEIVVNAIHHGYPAHCCDHPIHVHLALEGDSLTIIIRDKADPFDPLIAPPPDLTRPLEERAIGGLGIHFVRKFMDRLEYQRDKGWNIITMTKRVQ